MLEKIPRKEKPNYKNSQSRKLSKAPKSRGVIPKGVGQLKPILYLKKFKLGTSPLTLDAPIANIKYRAHVEVLIVGLSL